MRLSNNLNDIVDTHNVLSWQDISTDMVLSLCGKNLGDGCIRSAYVYNLDDKYVIKLESGNSGHNLVEYLLWQEIKELQGDLEWVKTWFAPIKWISPNGKLLVMERTFEKPDKERPTTVPAFFTDLKRNNWGWIGNKFVCHDYAFICKFINYSSKMQKIKKDCWW